jgi:hypothetical protein
MATGYTHIIGEGVSFRKFALTCARAFGATIDMRDDPLDAPIPDTFTPSNYHLEALEKAKAELTEVIALTDEQIAELAIADYNAEVKALADSRAERDALRAKYDAMLDQVKAWEVPTEEHQGLKDFMISQITESIEHDCNGSYFDRTATLLSNVEWLEKRSTAIRWSLKYHTESHAKEIASTTSRSKWVNDLRASLPKE